MAVIDTYSRRKRLAEQGEEDVYIYDTVPTVLRAQVEYIWDDAIGPYWKASGFSTGMPPANNNTAWRSIRHQLCREKGVLSLANSDSPKQDCITYLHHEQHVDAWLDIIELSFTYIEQAVSRFGAYDRQKCAITLVPSEAIDELNTRFRLASFGYRFEGGQIIRVDSELLHAEVVKPALHFLADDRFSGPREEYLSAHAHYRAGENKDAITDANNAFESTLKTICDLKGWEYPAGARASDLLKVTRANNLLPDYLDTSFDQLAATLKSGLPVVRNQEGSHGQGAEPKTTPDYIAAYALHLAAAKIMLLAEAFNAGLRTG